MTRIYTFFIVLVFTSGISAQVIYTIPAFPTQDEPITIIYDATLGNAALMDVPPPIYAHTGVITTESVSPTDWKNVQGVWGTADPEVLMTEIGDDLYQLSITSINDFYGLTADDTVLQMAFVFRNEPGAIVGRDTDGSDIYVDVYEPGLNVAITSPVIDPLIVSPGENVHIEVISVLADSMYLYVDGVELVATDIATIAYDIIATELGPAEIRVVAKGDGDIKVDSTYYYVIGDPIVEAVPAGLKQGINYINDTTITLILFAPFKEYIFAVGEHSNWTLSEESFMKLDPDNATWWVTLTHLIPGKEYPYQYFIDGVLWVADPLTEKVLDPWNDGSISEETYPDLLDYPFGKTTGIVSVFQTAQPEYAWAITDFIPPATDDLVVYELLIRDFVAKHNYQTLLDTLSYLKTLGVNAIEFMPVMEFEANESWGYNPSFFIALDKYYGTREAFKIFIDSCHANGIAVILDIAMNHAFGQSPLVQMWWDAALNAPADNSPYFNQIPTHDYNVGYDFNHESSATINMRNIVFTYWLQEFNVDGYRFDLSKGFTQNNTLGDVGAWGLYDADRINTWKNIGDVLWDVNPNAKLILEHFAENTEEKELANYGFMLWGNSNYNYAQATMGYTGSDVSWMSYQNRGWNDPHVMGYMESHDEERLMFKNLEFGNTVNPDHNVKDLNTALYRMETAGALFFTIPGPKMIWQFGEMGYDISIEYGCRVCNKPILWDYITDNNRLRIYQVWSELIHLKKTYSAFSTDDYNLSVSGFGKRINLNDPTMNVTVLGNFDVNLGSVNPNFQHNGWWFEYFSGDSINVIDVSSVIALNPGEYRLYTDKRLTTPEIIDGIGELYTQQKNDLFIYPNPSSTNFVIETFLTKNSDAAIEIYNASGEIVYAEQLKNQPSGILTFNWNTNSMKAGIYVCKIVAGDKVSLGKMVLVD